MKKFLSILMLTACVAQSEAMENIEETDKPKQMSQMGHEMTSSESHTQSSSHLLSNEAKPSYYLTCTAGCEDKGLKEIIKAHGDSIIGLNLENASGLDNIGDLFRTQLPSLKYLKMRFGVEEILDNLSDNAPQLEILDISGTKVFNSMALQELNKLSSLRVVDISNISCSEKILDSIDEMLSQNPYLNIYVKSLKKLSPKGKIADLSKYDSETRVVRDTYSSSTKEAPEFLNQSKLYIY